MYKKPIPDDELLKLIPKLAKQAQYRFTTHALQRLRQRDRNFTEDRMLFILKNPKSIRAEWDATKREFKYVVEGYNKRHVVISIRNYSRDNTYMSIITVY
ncbi:DUF4258 domain-containing protein [Paenibacillus spiritus]|uniref:DUF4258 domain-containing protein n=1 Tax=Paenibacillus spiritus TaxID=2496557 RepID=A0A5J5GGM3_9BACL|nr:DUF4258 domain-containing protein [Paenibacillus spiritus]KAA9007359.1 DUF4258 domain-containing protein [Paenibacillus spiritus]